MARKDEFDFDIPSRKEKKEKKEKPQREEKESKPLFGDGSFLDKLPFKKSSSFDDEFSIKKEKKEKKQREKKESKPLFGEDSFFSGLFKKAPSLDNDFSFNKEEKDKGEKSPKRLKWWHILLIVLGAIIIVVGIVVGIIIGQINENVPGGVGGIIEGGDDLEDEIAEPEGIVSSVGTFLPKDSQEYILCEYTEYFSGEKVCIVQKESDLLYGYKGYFVFISYTGEPLYNYSGEYTGEYTPEQIKADMLRIMSGAAGYTPDKIALCDVHVYEAVSFTRVMISSATVAEDGSASIKYSVGAVDGEMSEEYTLTGTYAKEGNDFTFTYTNLPEDEILLRVAEKLLSSAKYENHSYTGTWVNELTFGDNYKLTLISPTEEE